MRLEIAFPDDFPVGWFIQRTDRGYAVCSFHTRWGSGFIQVTMHGKGDTPEEAWRDVTCLTDDCRHFSVDQDQLICKIDSMPKFFK